ncbi:MAG: exodeoxyribonuclease VII small subunit [Clostridia bacterium]|nr:exodeoxyribonuclease VII small subunit [Clostridia bacterium]
MAKKTVPFEESMARLEEILAELEGGDGSLDELLKLYTEGVALIRTCNEQLEKAEQSVKMLQMQPDGSVAKVDFDSAED